MKKKILLDDLGELFAKGMNIKADIVPMIDEDNEDLLLNDDGIEGEMPVLPVMDQVLLPGVILPIAARREKSRQLLDDAGKRHILVFTQRNDIDDPTDIDLYPVGVVAKVLKVFEIRDNTTVAVLQGVQRCHSLMLTHISPYMKGRVVLAPESSDGIRLLTSCLMISSSISSTIANCNVHE